MRNRFLLPLSVASLLLALLFASLLSPSPLFSQNASGKKEEKKVQEKGTLYRLNVSVTLGDGRKVEGILSLRAPDSFTLRHSREGITYEKKLSLPGIRAVEIRRWKGIPVRKNRQGEIYRFEPASYVVELKDDSNLVHEGELFSFLKEPLLKNRNGSVKLFSYWLDLRREDNTWYTGMEGPVDGFRNVPHKDVIKRIDFFGDDSRAGVEP